MFRSLLSILIALVLTSAFAQETHEVEMIIEEVEGSPLPEFYFQPTGLFIQPGDTVRFVAASPHHTITAYHEAHVKSHRVPEGVEPFSSPIVPVGESWEYTFETPGVYDLWCGPHEQYGMVMRVVVGEASGPGAEPATDFSPAGTFGAAGVVLNDPALDADNIIEQGSVMWQDLETTLPPAEEGEGEDAPGGGG